MDKKGEKIALLDIHEFASFADYFIICSGTSNRMLSALADMAAETAKKNGARYARVEGKPDYGWIIVDCGDVIIHLFTPEKREYYSLEKLWEKAHTLVRIQ